MPTLIRLLIALLFLCGLGFAGLYGLSIFVDPGEKQIVVKIPARDLVLTPAVPKPEPRVTEAAVLPTATDDKGTKEVDATNE
jgi:hypothetical protein